MNPKVFIKFKKKRLLTAQSSLKPIILIENPLLRYVVVSVIAFLWRPFDKNFPPNLGFKSVVRSPIMGHLLQNGLKLQFKSKFKRRLPSKKSTNFNFAGDKLSSLNGAATFSKTFHQIFFQGQLKIWSLQFYKVFRIHNIIATLFYKLI